MKTFVNWSLNIESFPKDCKNIFLCFILSTIFFFHTAYSQTGPGMHWSRDQWYGMNNNIEQEDSGEDWHYGISPYFNDNILTGYIAAGYSTTLNDFGNFDCMDCEEFSYDCKELETPDFQRGCVYPKLAEMDKNGNVEWYEIYTRGLGWFRKVIQLDDESGYVAVGHIKYDGGEDPGDLVYNPGTDDDYLPECEGSPYQLMYVVRTDMEGVIQEEAVYGIVPAEDAIDRGSQAYGIIQDDDGELIIAGYAYDASNTKRGYVLKLDETTLEVNYEAVLFGSDTYESHSTCLIEMDDNYYIFSTKYTAAAPDLYGHIFITKLNNTLDVVGTTFEVTSTEEPDLDGLADYCSSIAFDVIIDDGDLVTGVQVNRNDGVQSINDQALVRAYRIHPGTSPEWTFEANLSIVNDEEEELFRAYDLKVGITNTDDGGFAVTSTIHDGDLFEDDENDYEYFPDCDPFTAGNQPCTCDLPYDWTYSWNGDPYIAKFNSSDELEWRASYPVTNAYGSYYPQDVKRLECVYEILQDDVGGYILAGNNSKNFDDDFVMRIFDDCNIYATYTGDYDLVDPSAITSSVTWSNNAKIKGIVTIESGGTLTINNGAVIQFADSKAANHPTYIRVKRGGRLIVEGGAKLTGNMECGTMWEGIYVEGTSGISHPTPPAFISAGYTNSDHGFVWVKGDAIIEKARTAVNLGLPAKFPPPVSGTWGGGLIIADDAHFINNATDIYFYPFGNVNRSLIRNSEFLTNSALADMNEIPQAHIELKMVKGVNIRGNYFENSVSGDIYNGTDRGAAVRAADAAFKFNDNPNAFGATGGTGSAPNTVIDVYYGIYATQFTVAPDNIVIDANIFQYNARGVYLGGTELAEVNLNSFTLDTKANYALYLDASTDYGVEENTITGAGSTNPQSQSGIIVNDNGTSNNRIYRNSFSDLVYGIKSENNNGSTTSGIVFKCNTFDEDKYDIAVTSGSVKEDQGACITDDDAAPAGNIFTDNLSTSTTQFAANSGVDDIIYHHHEDLDASNAPFYEPYEFSSSVISLDECGENYNSTTSCPDDFSDGGGSRMASEGLKQNFSTLYLVTRQDSTDSFGLDIIRNSMLRGYMNAGETDSILSVLNGDSSLRSISLRVVIAMYNEDNEVANEYIESMSENINDEDEGYSEELYSIALSLKTDSLTWFDMNEEQLGTVKELTTHEGRIGVVAKLILESVLGFSYEEPIEEIDVEFEEGKAKKYNIEPLKNAEIRIYPNPVGDQSAIEILLPRQVENGQFVIYDMQGREKISFNLNYMSNLIIVNNKILKQGLYSGLLLTNDTILNAIKFVVIE